MPVVHIAVSMLLSIATVTGGTDAQRKSVEDTLKKVPECLQSCDGKTPKVEIVASDELNASYDGGADALRINDCLLDEKRRAESLAKVADEQCTDTAKFPTDPRRVMVHELAHYYYQHHLLDSSDDVGDGWHRNLDGTGPNDRGRAFLSIRFEALWDTWSKSKTAADLDASLQQLGAKLDSLRAAGKAIPPAVQKMFCDLQDQLSKEYQSSPMPERYRHDRHAFDGNGPGGVFGTEYFAIAIETMLFEPDAFCAAYSADEQAWLMKEMGKCLQPMLHGEPCSAGGQPTGGGVTR
jgi:hypothetical protein